MKKKVEKGKVDNATKKTRRSVEKELVSGEEDAEETIEAKETAEEELEMMPGIKAVAGIKSNNRQSEKCPICVLSTGLLSIHGGNSLLLKKNTH